MAKERHVNRYVTLIVLCFCEITYVLPYLRWTYYDSMLVAFQCTNTQLASQGAIFGALAAVCYLFGGPLCDRVSPRRLLMVSLGVEAITGFWYATFPPYWACAIIYAIWGICTSLLLWDCMIRVTRTLGSSEEQGKFFGLLEGGRGALDTITGLVFVAIFAALGSSVLGLRQIIIITSILCALGVVFVFFTVEDKIYGSEPGEVFHLRDAGAVLKNPAVWLISLVILCNYSIYTGGTYLTPYLTDIIGISAAAAATISIFRNYVIMMIGGPIGGFIASKSSITKTIIGCFVLILIACLAMAIVPETVGVVIPIVMMMALYLGLFFMRGIYFGTVDEARIPMKVTGTAIGIISVIGFIPEVFMNSLSGYLLDAYPGIAGYHYLFYVLLGFAVVGLAISFVLFRHIRKLNQQAASEKLVEASEQE